MLKAKAGRKRWLLEKAEFLFTKSALLEKSGQQYIQKFYSTAICQPRNTPNTNTVWPQNFHSTQTKISPFFTGWKTR